MENDAFGRAHGKRIASRYVPYQSVCAAAASPIRLPTAASVEPTRDANAGQRDSSAEHSAPAPSTERAIRSWVTWMPWDGGMTAWTDRARLRLQRVRLLALARSRGGETRDSAVLPRAARAEKGASGWSG